MNLHTQVAAKFGCEKDFCVSHDWMGVFCYGAVGGHAAAPPLHCWHRGLEMLTHRAERSLRNPRNPPEKTLGGSVRWNLGMHSEESVTYLLAELSEPCLSQPLPP